MLYDSGLILSVAIGAWLALDFMMAEAWRRRSVSIGLLGGSGALWAAGELLLRSAELPHEFAIGRRVLYMGVLGTAFTWYWAAVEADLPDWSRRSRWRVGLPGLPLLLIYSCLFWAPDGVVISLYTPKPQHGPLYFVAAVIGWGMTTAGLVHYSRAALRLRHKSGLRTAALFAGVVIPLSANVLYTAGVAPLDASPAMLGFAVLMIRFAVIDAGLAPYLPLARSDIIEQLAVGIVVMDLDDRVIDANASASRLLGESAPVGHRFEDLLPGVAHNTELIRFHLHSNVSIAGSAVVLTDRSQAVRDEERLQLAVRLEALGSLTAGIAKEVDDPLTFIRASLTHAEKQLESLMSAERSNGEAARHELVEAADALSDAGEGIERIALLGTRLRSFAGTPRQDGAEAEIDVVPAIHSAIAVAGVGLPGDAILMRCDGEPAVRGQEHVVVQILVNLLLNAIQASRGEPRIEVGVRAVGREVAVDVSDRGAGLEPDALTRVFDPFYTTKAMGSGLGLSISFELATNMGGRIEAANRAGGGATFSLVMPRAGTPVQSAS